MHHNELQGLRRPTLTPYDAPAFICGTHTLSRTRITRHRRSSDSFFSLLAPIQRFQFTSGTGHASRFLPGIIFLLCLIQNHGSLAHRLGFSLLRLAVARLEAPARK